MTRSWVTFLTGGQKASPVRICGGSALLTEEQQVQRACGGPRPGICEQQGDGCGQGGTDEGEYQKTERVTREWGH